MITTTTSNPKCAGCGLVNFAEASECKRCGAALDFGDAGHFAPRAFEVRPESFETTMGVPRAMPQGDPLRVIG